MPFEAVREFVERKAGQSIVFGAACIGAIGGVAVITHYDGCWREHHDCAVAEIERINFLNDKLKHDTGKGCSVCGDTPVVNVPGGSGTYWLCGGCVAERLDEKYDLQQAADSLYRALRLMPCACCYEWRAREHIRVKECVRCRAIREWEEMTKLESL